MYVCTSVDRLILERSIIIVCRIKHATVLFSSSDFYSTIMITKILYCIVLFRSQLLTLQIEIITYVVLGALYL